MREVPIPDILIPVLKKCCSNRDGKEILFPKSDGKYATKQTCTWWYKSFKRTAHLAAGAKVYRNQILVETSKFDDKITPHYLRHTYATDLYAAGVDTKAQKYFLGHASADITDRYSQMNDIAFERARQQINEYICTLNLKFPLDNL